MIGPKCHRCGDSINGHGNAISQPCRVAGCDCPGFIWPDSFRAAVHDLDIAMGELRAAIVAEVRALWRRVRG